MTLLSLAARCEKAEGPDRDIDLEIMRYAMNIGGPAETAKPYSSSLDAAMTLVPEGADGVVLNSKIENFHIDDKRRGHIVYLFGPFTGAHFTGRAATDALALCAAALRARATPSKARGKS